MQSLVISKIRNEQSVELLTTLAITIRTIAAHWEAREESLPQTRRGLRDRLTLEEGHSRVTF